VTSLSGTDIFAVSAQSPASRCGPILHAEEFDCPDASRTGPSQAPPPGTNTLPRRHDSGTMCLTQCADLGGFSRTAEVNWLMHDNDQGKPMNRIGLALIALLGLMIVAQSATAEPDVCDTLRKDIVVDVTSKEGWGPIIHPKLDRLRQIDCVTDYVPGTQEPAAQCDALRLQILANTVASSPGAGTIPPVMKVMGCKMSYAADGKEPPTCQDFMLAGATQPQPVAAAILGIMGNIGCKPAK
jgi:hypothetical protein